MRPAPLAWPRGWRSISSTFTAPGRWRAVGCGALIACSTRSSRPLTMAGSLSTTATSPMRAVTPPGLGSLPPLPPSTDGGSASRTSRCSVSRSKGPRSWRQRRWTRACATATATATALGGEATIPIAGAWACCFLVTACTSVLDYERAFEWCDRIAQFAERYGSRYMLAFCRAEYGAVHLWRGRWSDAETMLAASLEDFSRSRPAWAGAPLVGLAELRRRQGRAAEAALLLDQARGSPGAQLCRARLALDRGEALRAAELLERLLRQTPVDRRLERAPALELLVHARVARGELDQAVSALEAFREVERLVGTSPLRAGADLAEGILAAAGGDHDRARRLLEDSLDGFERSGGPFEAAQARIQLATSLVALGRTDAAEREAAAALDCLLGLGAKTAAGQARRLLDEVAGAGRFARPEVTVREREVLSLLVEGLTNRQIAERLVVSEHTVHRHVTNILRKLDLPSRTAAAAYAARAGLLPDPGA
jgi:DNA-binding NarL/FixJ family response regulator